MIYLSNKLLSWINNSLTVGAMLFSQTDFFPPPLKGGGAEKTISLGLRIVNGTFSFRLVSL